MYLIHIVKIVAENVANLLISGLIYSIDGKSAVKYCIGVLYLKSPCVRSARISTWTVLRKLLGYCVTVLYGFL